MHIAIRPTCKHRTQKDNEEMQALIRTRMLSRAAADESMCLMIPKLATHGHHAHADLSVCDLVFPAQTHRVSVLQALTMTKINT